MVMADEVLFVIVSDSVLLVPTGTDPKFRLPLPSPTVPPPFEPEDRPWHPVSSNSPPATTKKMAKRRYNRITFFCDLCVPLRKPRRPISGRRDPRNPSSGETSVAPGCHEPQSPR